MRRAGSEAQPASSAFAVISRLSGLPDLRVEPEDEIDITLSRQNVAGTFIVDDVALAVEFGEQPRSSMQISTRQQVAL